MNDLVKRIVLSVVIGVVVFLIVTLVGILLVALEVDFAVSVGAFLKTYASLIGLLAAIWFFFTGRTVLNLPQ